MRHVFLILLFLVATAAVASQAGAAERAFSWTQAPGKGDYVAVDLHPYQLSKYLSECELNRPEVVNDIQLALKDGEYYRKRTKDQKSRPVLITASVNPQYMLRIVTWRNDTCENCNGSGKKNLPFGENYTKHVNVNFNCPDCKGKGFIENNTTEKYFILSAEDFRDREEGRRIMREKSFAGAPDGADAWVEKLASKDPNERLAACVWLDRNYVREGVEFQRLMPMLKKARYHESNPKKKIMVWQFWAGKDLPDERNRAYYRVYANTKNGKITKKGFFPAY